MQPPNICDAILSLYVAGTNDRCPPAGGDDYRNHHKFYVVGPMGIGTRSLSMHHDLDWTGGEDAAEE